MNAVPVSPNPEAQRVEIRTPMEVLVDLASVDVRVPAQEAVTVNVSPKGGGNTALYDAIAVYLSRVQDSEGRKVLVVLTDGEDSTSSVGLG